MAYLALDIAEVLCVLRIISSIHPNVLMAVFTLNSIWIIIPCSGKSFGPVQSIVMTFSTDHTFFRPVNVTGDSFILSQILSSNTGAMTGNAVVLGRWCFPYLMA